MASPLNLFVGKASNILRVLLANHPKTWTLRELSKEAGVSLGWASKVSEALIRERLAVRNTERAELQLLEPSNLLKRWASFNNFIANTTFIDYHWPKENISELIDLFKGNNGPDYAFTALAGALLIAPLVKPTKAHIYVKSETDAKLWAKSLGLSPVEENGNVKFAIAENNSVFYHSKRIDDVRIVSDLQLFVDLLNYPCRGAEAAEKIYKLIEKRWKNSKNGKS